MCAALGNSLAGRRGVPGDGPTFTREQVRVPVSSFSRRGVRLLAGQQTSRSEEEIWTLRADGWMVGSFSRCVKVSRNCYHYHLKTRRFWHGAVWANTWNLPHRKKKNLFLAFHLILYYWAPLTLFFLDILTVSRGWSSSRCVEKSCNCYYFPLENEGILTRNSLRRYTRRYKEKSFFLTFRLILYYLTSSTLSFSQHHHVLWMVIE